MHYIISEYTEKQNNCLYNDYFELWNKKIRKKKSVVVFKLLNFLLYFSLLLMLLTFQINVLLKHRDKLKWQFNAYIVLYLIESERLILDNPSAAK